MDPLVASDHRTSLERRTREAEIDRDREFGRSFALPRSEAPGHSSKCSLIFQTILQKLRPVWPQFAISSHAIYRGKKSAESTKIGDFSNMFLSSKNRKRNTSKLSVESLNCRIVPAVVLTKLDLDGDAVSDDIRIIGDFQNTKIVITDDGAGLANFQIDANGDGDFADVALGDLNTSFAFNDDTFVLEAQLRGGNDSISYFTTANNSDSTRTLTIDLGAGNDTFLWTHDKDVFNGSSISLDITAGAGNDLINVTNGQIRASQESVKVDAGSGNDKYDLKFDRIDDHSTIDIHTDLGNGLNIQNAEFQEIGFGDQAVVDMVVVGGANKDTIQLGMHDDIGNGVTASHFSAVFDLLAGNDDFKALYDVGGDVFRVDDHSQSSLVVRGGAGNDSLLAGQNGLTGTMKIDPDALFAVDLDGGSGNDSVITSFGTLNAWELIGGIRVRMDGGYGNDTLTCLLSHNFSSTGIYDVVVRGGAGNDIMSFNLFNGGGTPTFGPAGGVVLDGGIGIDSLINGNPAVTKSVGIETVV